MPQLDVLTYFHQYIYLLVTFVAVYLFVLSFIIPTVVSTLKIRRKLNTISLITNKLNQVIALSQSESFEQPSGDYSYGYGDIQTGGYCNIEQQESEVVNPLFQHCDDLIIQNWKIGTAKRKKDWLLSTRTLQLSQTLRLKKLFARNIVRRISKP